MSKWRARLTAKEIEMLNWPVWGFSWATPVLAQDVFAQRIEAQRAATTGAVEDESLVPQGCAPPPYFWLGQSAEPSSHKGEGE